MALADKKNEKENHAILLKGCIKAANNTIVGSKISARSFTIVAVLIE